jgi:anti-anti-sigma factor
MAKQTTTTAGLDSARAIEVVQTVHGQEVYLAGRVDVRSAADLRLDLHAILAGGTGDLLLHLGDVEIGDATGLGVLLESHRRARREGRRLVLASITPRTARLLRAARLHRVFHLAAPAEGAPTAPARPTALAPLTA